VAFNPKTPIAWPVRDSGTASVHDPFLSAIDHYMAGRWCDALDQFAALADQNDSAAARCALLMLKFGATSRGASIPVTDHQIQHWRRLAGNLPMDSSGVMSVR